MGADVHTASQIQHMIRNISTSLYWYKALMSSVLTNGYCASFPQTHNRPDLIHFTSSENVSSIPLTSASNCKRSLSTLASHSISTHVDNVASNCKIEKPNTAKTGGKASQNDDINPNKSADDSTRPHYLDYQATTPLDPRVLDEMLPYMVDIFGNAHSRSHSYGWECEEKVEAARLDVANIIKSKPKEIIFTSGATESNNLAIKGCCKFYGSKKKNHIITTQIEHKCVLASCRQLGLEGYDVTYLPVNSDGLISLEDLEKSITDRTIIVSIMHVNNEIGVVQDIAKIGEICRRKKVIFHTDAAQSVGKLDIDVVRDKVDLLSISAHKLYGPKGIGALYVNSKPRVRLAPIIDGGGQERGMRSGTLPVHLIVGFGGACRVCMDEMHNDKKWILKLAHKLRTGIEGKLPDVIINGSSKETERYFGNINFSFSYVEGESLLMSLRNIAVSSGSACTSASLEPSYVLRALGVNEELAHTSIRFGIGRFTTEQEIDECVDAVVESVTQLREMSPLWEMAESQRLGHGDAKMVWT